MKTTINSFSGKLKDAMDARDALAALVKAAYPVLSLISKHQHTSWLTNAAALVPECKAKMTLGGDMNEPIDKEQLAVELKRLESENDKIHTWLYEHGLMPPHTTTADATIAVFKARDALAAEVATLKGTRDGWHIEAEVARAARDALVGVLKQYQPGCQVVLINGYCGENDRMCGRCKNTLAALDAHAPGWRGR